MKIAVCDDDPRDIERISRCMVRLVDFAVEYGFFHTPMELLRASFGEGQSPDIYILDIEMPGMNGLEVAKAIRIKDSKALIVFLTSHVKYMPDVFEVVTFDFISKPITEERLRALLDKAETYLNRTDQSFLFTFRQCRYSLKYDEILYLEKRGRQVIIHTDNEIYRAILSISELWEKLDKKVFAAAHGSYVVNLEHVRSVSHDEVELRDGTKILISRSCRGELTRRYMDFIEGDM